MFDGPQNAFFPHNRLSDGQTITTIGTGSNLILGLAVQPDGKLVVSGSARGPGNSWNDSAIARYNSNGVLDPTFGRRGVLTMSFSSTDDRATRLCLQSDGKIVVAGYDGDFTVARYLINSPRITDYDGDINADLSVYRPSNGGWYISRSTSGF